MSAENELMALIEAAGINRPLAIALIVEIKHDAVMEDNAFESEVSNLRNAIEDAKSDLQKALSTLRNA